MSIRAHHAALLAGLLLLGCRGEARTAAATAGDHESLDERARVLEEVAKWRGRWRCVSRNEEGNLVPAEEVGRITLTVGGTMYHFQWGDDFDELGHYEFHPDEFPAAVDAHIADPPEMRGSVVHLIYRMEGDRLLLSHREDNKRPTDFVAEPDSGQTVEEWVRIRPPSEAQARASREPCDDDPDDGEDD